MPKKMLIDATHAEETRVVVVDGNKVEEFDFESLNKRQLAGNIYLAKVTRVEPSLQAAFVDYGGNRHGFLAFSEVHPDYYQIPVADRQALLEEERAYAKKLDEDDEDLGGKRRSSRSRGKSRAQDAQSDDAVVTRDAGPDAGADEARQDGGTDTPAIAGMDVIDLEGDAAPDAGKTTEAPAIADADARADGDRTDRVDEGARNGAHEDPDDHEADDDAEDAADRDKDIESIADEDVTEEIRQPRKVRPKKYKIQEVIKVRQILLVQVVKEERGNKGAALTTYLSLAGRYCVLMPNTARGGGISRKITNAADRKKLKTIANEIDVPDGAGLIIRTAGAQRTKSEIRRDYEYLLRLWEQIRELTLKSIAPAPIYEEGNLIKRSIRDLYNRDIDEVFVEGEHGYRVAKDFMKMLMPSHAKNVKHYNEPMPLFARYQVESYLAGMFNPTVQLKSGGYIVIGVTEALVAIDVNSGRATKEGSIEDTATKTNLEAAEEVARQLRLRDLAGLIVIDFIDMDERKNNAAVEKRFKEKLKTDRARIQVGRISGFGLMEMSRQRLRPGMLEATTQPCPACHGTGLIRSDDSLALSILRQLEEEGVRRRSREVLVKAPVGIVNFIMNQKREHVAMIEARYGLSIRMEADPFLVSPDFNIEKFKTATRAVPEVVAPVISVDMTNLPEIEEEVEEPSAAAAVPEAQADDEGQPKKRRRRRRRRRGGKGEGEGENESDTLEANGEEAQEDAQGGKRRAAAADSKSAREDTAAEAEEPAQAEAAAEAEGPAQAEAAADTPAEKPAKKKTVRRSRKKTPDSGAETAPDAGTDADKQGEAESADAAGQSRAAQPADAAAEKPKRAPRKRAPRKKKEPEMAETAVAEATLPDAAETPRVQEPVLSVVGDEDTGGLPPQPAPDEVPPAPQPQEVPVPGPDINPEPVPVEHPVPSEPDLPPSGPQEVPAMQADAPEADAEDVPQPGDAEAAEEEDKPRRRGWWSLSR
ncbi:Rne/Rng family ribonuclease [Brevirhabdus sp.]|uniref:Rne/Rng family ribonuclease n=1 Tax=Brevirhabdus sp. TaxID=2004514 RepID=UPI004057EF3B